jgi:hypothetical protein
MPKEVQQRVHTRFTSSGALPVSRDTPSYVAVLSVLLGGAGGQLDYLSGAKEGSGDDVEETKDPLSSTGVIEYDMWDSRAEAKKAQAERLELAKQMGFNLGNGAKGGAGGDGDPDGAGMQLLMYTFNSNTIYY